MAVRFPALLAATLLCASAAMAQERGTERAPLRELNEPPAKLQKPQRGDPTKNLDFLFEALKAAPDEASAKSVEDRIWALWFVSRSDTANLLMTRVRGAVEAKDLDLAIKLLDSIVEIKPDFVEAWNRRATIYYMRKDYGRALEDIREVLRREPRHFGALSGLGMLMQEIGDEKRALEVYRRAQAVHPRIQKIPELIKTLQEKVEGRDI
ncbi:MAG: tetratricopeptide repeat protein [Pseudolabrys sp.]|nr:tetratricopeptide repeat protein [Pseudolabrys sp.]